MSNGSVYMVSYNDLKNFIQLNEKRIFQALSFDEKFQNFRVTCAKCILVCCSATRKKNQDFITSQFFQVNKSEEHCWDFLLNFKLGKICYQTSGPMRHLWTLIKRQGRWNSAHWWDGPIPSKFLQIQKTEEPNNRNYSAPSNFLTFRRPRPKFSILPLLMYSPGPAKYMGICPHLLLDRYVNPISTKGSKLCP